MKSQKTPAIPLRYDIWQQDLSKDYIALTLMGFVNTQAAAREMLKAFNACDAKEVENGHHAYFFSCSKIQNID